MKMMRPSRDKRRGAPGNGFRILPSTRSEQDNRLEHVPDNGVWANMWDKERSKSEHELLNKAKIEQERRLCREDPPWRRNKMTTSTSSAGSSTDGTGAEASMTSTTVAEASMTSTTGAEASMTSTTGADASMTSTTGAEAGTTFTTGAEASMTSMTCRTSTATTDEDKVRLGK